MVNITKPAPTPQQKTAGPEQPVSVALGPKLGNSNRKIRLNARKSNREVSSGDPEGQFRQMGGRAKMHLTRPTTNTTLENKCYHHIPKK